MGTVPERENIDWRALMSSTPEFPVKHARSALFGPSLFGLSESRSFPRFFFLKTLFDGGQQRCLISDNTLRTQISERHSFRDPRVFRGPVPFAPGV